MHSGGTKHDQSQAVLGDIAVLADAAGSKERDLVLLALGDQVEIAFPQAGGNRVAHGIHADVVGCTGTAVHTINHQGGGIGITDQIVEY